MRETGHSWRRFFNRSNFGWRFSRDFARFLLIAALTVLAAVVLLNLKNNLWSFSRSRKLQFGSGEKTARPDVAERMERSQAHADDLAEAGSFAEAMHELLLRSVNEMRNRLDSPIAASLTSREILRHIGLSDEERDVFATIVGSVEISRFGPHNPGEGEYAACRRCFDRLTSLLSRGDRK
jgi:hypothetical protein